MRELVLRPSLGMRLGFALLFLVLSVMVLAGLKDWPPAGLHDYVVIATPAPSDDATRSVLLILKREFGPIESLEARTRSWMRAQDRLAEAAL